MSYNTTTPLIPATHHGMNRGLLGVEMSAPNMTLSLALMPSPEPDLQDCTALEMSDLPAATPARILVL